MSDKNTARLSIDLDPELIKAAKVQAAAEGLNLKELIEKVLNGYIPKQTRKFVSSPTISAMKPNVENFGAAVRTNDKRQYSGGAAVPEEVK